jgi:nitrate/nitrite transporter NarK
VVISQWFKDKELALALGLNITISRLGSSINSALTPYIFEHQVNSGSSHPFFLPTFIGLIACILSWVAGLGMCYMDKESDRREGKLDDIIEKDESEQINLKDIFKFDIKLWILVVTCTLIYGSFFAFNGNANDILHNMYNIPTGIAGVYLLVIYLSASIVTPMFGLVVDKYGRRVLLMILSITLFLIALVVFCIIPSDCNQIIPLIPLILIGLFYATYAAIFWPCIPLVVD